MDYHGDMYQYVLLDDDEKFLDQVKKWKEEGISSVAMDFEGEFNLHIYGEHLCLIQLYDRKEFFLADPFRLSKVSLASLFCDKGMEKIMFACESDATLIRKEYGLQLENVYDVRVPAMAIDYTGNLSGLMDLYQLPHAQESKKKNQMNNWLRRPIPEHQIQYALGDVAQLFALKEIMEKEIVDRKKEKQVRDKMKDCAKQKNPERPGWEKLPSYRYLNWKEMAYAKHLFLARDAVARRRNVPAAHIMDKRLLVVLAKRLPQTIDDVKRDVQVPGLLDAFAKAIADAREEIGDHSGKK